MMFGLGMLLMLLGIVVALVTWSLRESGRPLSGATPVVAGMVLFALGVALVVRGQWP